jgi:hypothetical protein
MELKPCPHCGADCETSTARCWLCYGDLTGEVGVVDAELVPEPPRHAPEDTIFGVMSAILAFVIVLVGVGAAFVQPGLSILIAIVAVPAFVATLVRVKKQEARQGHVGWGEKLGTFVVSAALTIGVLTMLGVACIIALIVFCFYLLATDGFR